MQQRHQHPERRPQDKGGFSLVKACSVAGKTYVCFQHLTALGVGPIMRRHIHTVLTTNCNEDNSWDQSTDSRTSAVYQACTAAIRQMTLTNTVRNQLFTGAAYLIPPDFAWTDLTYLLHKYGKSWAYYGARLDPATDGRPDPRLDVRESDPRLGDLGLDFDFNQPPRPPLVLPGATRF